MAAQISPSLSYVSISAYYNHDLHLQLAQSCVANSTQVRRRNMPKRSRQVCARLLYHHHVFYLHITIIQNIGMELAFGLFNGCAINLVVCWHFKPNFVRLHYVPALFDTIKALLCQPSLYDASDRPRNKKSMQGYSYNRNEKTNPPKDIFCITLGCQMKVKPSPTSERTQECRQ